MTTTILDPVAGTATDHLTRVPGHNWAYWRSVLLRGAGFPVQWMARVGAPEAAAAADDLLSLEREFSDRRQELIAAVRKLADEAADKAARKALSKALDRLRKGKVPEALDAAVEGQLGAAQTAQARCEQARSSFEHRFAADLVKMSDALAEIANDDRFREAVLWQNRNALNIVSRSFSGPAGSRDRSSRQRQHEELIASYLQRYCVKNDSIGFFGPVAWMKFDAERGGLDVQLGEQLIRRSEVYFEHWAIEALAETIAGNKAVKPWIAPRRRAEFRLEGNRLHHPKGSEMIPPFVGGILAECDGVKTVPEIAARFKAILGPRAQEVVLQTLEQFAARDVITWRFELPLEQYPERKLRALLQRIEPDELRLPALRMLDELEAAREGVVRANGSVELDEALGHLDREFQRITGKPVTRAEGQMYAGRTLAYQDCARDIDVRVGAEVVTELGKPLGLLIASLRWLTHHAATLYREALQELHARLVAQSGSPAVDLLKFWPATEGVLIGEKHQREQRPIHRAVADFQARWESVLQLPEGQTRVHFTSEELRARVESAFAAPRAGWQMARYHSPDVMICAESPDAIRNGDYSLVLGEVHTAYNTALANFAMCQHPNPEEVLDALTGDMPAPQVWLLPPTGCAETTIRTCSAVRSRNDYYLDLFGDSMALGPARERLLVSDFVVESTPGGLIARSRDGKLRFDTINFFVTAMTAHVLSAAKMLARRAHAPRVTVDRMVLSRESWAFPATDLAFVRGDSERERFLGARRFMRDHNLPRLAFFRVHLERKPLYLDFDSPVYVETFCKCVRRVLDSDSPSEHVTMSEMLPTPDQAWLHDAAGQSYTSEFRVVVLDEVE